MVSRDRPGQVSEGTGVRLVRLSTFVDHRGTLAIAEAQGELPFVPQRFFLVFDVPAGTSRGVHAHRTTDQLLVAASGTVAVSTDDGVRQREFVLDAPTAGLLLPRLVWASQHDFSVGAVLLVLASTHFEAADYIDDRAEFLTIVHDAREG